MPMGNGDLVVIPGAIVATALSLGAGAAVRNYGGPEWAVWITGGLVMLVCLWGMSKIIPPSG